MGRTVLNNLWIGVDTGREDQGLPFHRPGYYWQRSFTLPESAPERVSSLPISAQIQGWTSHTARLFGWFFQHCMNWQSIPLVGRIALAPFVGKTLSHFGEQSISFPFSRSVWMRVSIQVFEPHYWKRPRGIATYRGNYCWDWASLCCRTSSTPLLGRYKCSRFIVSLQGPIAWIGALPMRLYP